MEPDFLLMLLAGVFIIAILYSAVGHAGASGYIAVMSLMSLAPAEIKPSALALNILVASIGTVQFMRAGHFSWRLFWPFAILAVPFAFVGGYVALPDDGFRFLVGLVLLFSATRLLFDSTGEREATLPTIPIALTAGAVIGLLSGLTGTGGGIFLTPLLLFMGWSTPKTAAAVSALFILLNSVAGLLGTLSSTPFLPSFLLPLLLAAGLGGLIGSHFGSRRLHSNAIKRVLAVVLVIAGTKMLFA